MQSPIYQDTPSYDLWLRAIIVGVLAATSVPGMLMLSKGDNEGWALLGTALFVGLVFKAVMPRRFEIFSDRLRIVLGGPFSVTVPFSKIREVRRGSKGFSLTVNFVTSVHNVLEIRKTRGLGIVISPGQVDTFLEQLAIYLGKDRVELRR